MQQLPPLVEVGFVQKTHGFRGELKCVFQSDYHILKGDWLFIVIDEKPVPFLVDSVRGDGSTLILKFNHSDDPAILSLLTGKIIKMDAKKAIDPDDDSGFHLSELVGFDLCNESGSVLGKIADYLEHPGQDLIVAHIDGKEVMIPVHESFILNVDLDNQKIEVSLPDDLINLNA